MIPTDHAEAAACRAFPPGRWFGGIWIKGHPIWQDRGRHAAAPCAPRHLPGRSL